MKLELCFKHLCEPLLLDDSTGYYCQNCKNDTIAINNNLIFSEPNTFIFLLEREKNIDNSLINIPFNLEV